MKKYLVEKFFQNVHPDLIAEIGQRPLRNKYTLVLMTGVEERGIWYQTATQEMKDALCQREDGFWCLLAIQAPQPGVAEVWVNDLFEHVRDEIPEKQTRYAVVVGTMGEEE